MNTKGKFFLGLAIVLGMILVLGLVLFNPLVKKQTPQPTDSDSTLYDSFDIPTTQIPYPNGWPQDLHYPQPLELVHASGNTEVGWEAALIYDGTAKEASDILENFFTNKGWVITDRTIVDENNLGLFIGRNNSQGFIIIGSDPSSSNIVKMTITVYE
jgi:hypothetical protein